MINYSKIWRVIRYVRFLGLPDAILIFLKFGKNKYSKQNDLIKINLQSIGHPIYIRKHTSDLAIFRQIFIEKQYSIQNRLNKLNPKIIIDAGANVGYSSLYFARKYPEARILAIEPEALNYEVLKMNTSYYKNIEPIHAALWYREGHLIVNNPESSKCAFQFSEVIDQVLDLGSLVPAVTLESIMKNRKIDKIDILKLDIEGSEKELFELGNNEWLEHTDVIIAELHDWLQEGCSRSFFRSVFEYNFKFFIRGENVVLIKP